MANSRQHPNPSAPGDGDELDEVLGRANPNPERVGCPSRDVLIALATRERAIGDPAYEHLLKCSPCYLEFRALQRAQADPVVAAPARRSWLVAAAAVVVLAIGGAWAFLSGDRAGVVPTGPPADVQTAAVQADVDLRPFTVVRSDQAAPEPPPVSLPRGVASLTILLPVGSEPGPYEIQVLDSERRPRASAQGEAEIRDFVTTLDVTIDLRSLEPGAYELAVRREGDDWRIVPAKVQ